MANALGKVRFLGTIKNVFFFLGDEFDVGGMTGKYQTVFDVVYALKSIATLYFIAHSKQASSLGLFGFYTHELQGVRTSYRNLGEPTELEMFALAGFADRPALLQDMHAWIVRKLHEGDTLAAAREISDTLAETRASIHQLKKANRVADTGQPRCPSKDLPVIEQWYDPETFPEWRRLAENEIERDSEAIEDVRRRRMKQLVEEHEMRTRRTWP